VVGKRRKGAVEVLDAPVDLASRIGGLALSPEPVQTAPETVRRVDGPIESDRSQRSRLMIGANEAPATRPVDVREPERSSSAAGSMMIGLEEVFTEAAAPAPLPAPAAEPVADETSASSAPIASVRQAPAAGEMDLVVTPLATPDDWHHFELALRRVPGVGPLRTEYYRAGILKLRLQWSGAERFAYAVANVPGYRVGILGEDRTTVQIRVARA